MKWKPNHWTTQKSMLKIWKTQMLKPTNNWHRKPHNTHQKVYKKKTTTKIKFQNRHFSDAQYVIRLVSLLVLIITHSALICSQHPNKCLNGKLTYDWLRKLHFGFQKPLKNQPLMKKYEDLPRLWLFWRSSEETYRVWVVNSWKDTLGLWQNQTKLTFRRWVSIACSRPQ